MLRIDFDVHGDRQLSRAFSRFAEQVKDLSEPFREIVKNFYEGERRQFESEGRYGSGGWTPLSPGYAEHKGPGSILVLSGILRDSLTGENPWAHVSVRPLSLVIGTRVPYAMFHQTGTRTMPARPIIALPEEQKTAWHKIIHRHLVEASRKALP